MFHGEGLRQFALRRKPRVDACAACGSRRLRKRSVRILAFLAQSVRALSHPYAALPNNERCISRHQSAAQQYLDQSSFGVLDLSGRATGGAFHPTAEGHAMIANDATVELCQRIGCGP
jgi:hypothetical protein